MKIKYSIILFLVVLIRVAYYYDYQTIAFKRPQSVHKWRQSDCASIALNYHQGGMNFFVPETHNLTSVEEPAENAAPAKYPFYIIP
jgi:hypothetical protein